MDQLTREVSQALKSAARHMGTYVPKSEWPDVLQDAIVASIERVDALPADAPGYVIPAVAYRACQDTLRRWITQRQRNAQMSDAYWNRLVAFMPATNMNDEQIDAEFELLSVLPPAYRGVALCLIDGESERDIASRFAMSRHEVRKTIDKIRFVFNHSNR